MDRVPVSVAQRQWRIKVKCKDGVDIEYEEPFTGSEKDARRRAWIMWARTSHIVNGRNNRDTYASLEVWDGGRHEYRMVKEKRGTYPRGWKAPAES